MPNKEYEITLKVTFKAMNSGLYGCIIETTPELRSPYIGVGDTPEQAMDKSLDDFWNLGIDNA